MGDHQQVPAPARQHQPTGSFCRGGLQYLTALITACSIICELHHILVIHSSQERPPFPKPLLLLPNTCQLQEGAKSHARLVPGGSSPPARCHDLSDAPTSSGSPHPTEVAGTAHSPPAATPLAAAVPMSAPRPNPSGFWSFAATSPESRVTKRPQKAGSPPKGLWAPGSALPLAGPGERTGKLWP